MLTIMQIWMICVHDDDYAPCSQLHMMRDGEICQNFIVTKGPTLVFGFYE